MTNALLAESLAVVQMRLERWLHDLTEVVKAADHFGACAVSTIEHDLHADGYDFEIIEHKATNMTKRLLGKRVLVTQYRDYMGPAHDRTVS